MVCGGIEFAISSEWPLSDEPIENLAYTWEHIHGAEGFIQDAPSQAHRFGLGELRRITKIFL